MTTEGTQEEVWTCRRDKAPVLGRGEEEGQAAIEYFLPPSGHTCQPASREQSIPAHHLSFTEEHAWPEAACNPGRLASPPAGSQPPPWFSLAWSAHTQEVPQSCGASLSGLPALQKSSTAQEHKGNPCLATGSVPPLRGAPASPAHPQEVLHSCEASHIALPTLRKSPAAQECQGKLYGPREKHLTCGAHLSVPTALWKCSFVSE